MISGVCRVMAREHTHFLLHLRLESLDYSTLELRQVLPGSHLISWLTHEAWSHFLTHTDFGFFYFRQRINSSIMSHEPKWPVVIQLRSHNWGVRIHQTTQWVSIYDYKKPWYPRYRVASLPILRFSFVFPLQLKDRDVLHEFWVGICCLVQTFFVF